MIETVLLWTMGVLFAAAAMLILIRIVRGPSILDRMIASDVLLTTLILVVGAEMVVNGHTRTVPLMLVLSALALVGSSSTSTCPSCTLSPSLTSTRRTTPASSGWMTLLRSLTMMRPCATATMSTLPKMDHSSASTNKPMMR